MIKENELIEIYQTLKKITKGESISNDTLFVQACTYHRGITMENNSKNIEQDRTKPTQKQLDYLKKEGYNGDLNILTREEAKQLISEHINSKREIEW